MKNYTIEEIIKARREEGLDIAGFPYEFGPEDFQLAGEDMVNNRTLVTIVDWARMTLLGANLMPHVPALDVEGRVCTTLGPEARPVELSDEELLLVRDAIDQYLSIHRKK